MSEHSTMTMAARPMKFGNVEYLVSPLSDRDIAELDEWIRAKYIQNARNSLTPENTPKEREETLALAMRMALTMSWMSGEGARMIGTIDGMTRLMWQSVKKLQPNVSFEELRGHLLNAENLDEANRVFRAANNIGEKKVQSPPPRKHQTRHRKGRSTKR